MGNYDIGNDTDKFTNVSGNKFYYPIGVKLYHE